ncbi:hypothetical protein NE865_14869 [Phthorimaea operculella]|nr:hypothetical protein NE865_14869 [Phthorimaea operculella]
MAALDDQLTPDQLNEMIAEIDTDESGTVDFDGKFYYYSLNSPLLDKSLHQSGVITIRLHQDMKSFKILAALDDQLTPDQLNEMIAEIDTDESGTGDFDEFMEMMTGD